jgi:hypothetical protein
MMPLMGMLLGIASLVVAGATSWLWWRGIQAVSLTDRRTGFFMGWGLAVALGFAAWFHTPGWLGGSAGALGMLLGGTFLCLGAFSAQAERTPAVEVGSAMLAFSAPDDSGAVFESVRFAGKPYLLKFFRGHW